MVVVALVQLGCVDLRRGRIEVEVKVLTGDLVNPAPRQPLNGGLHVDLQAYNSVERLEILLQKLGEPVGLLDRSRVPIKYETLLTGPADGIRSEERRVGTEGGYRGSGCER